MANIDNIENSIQELSNATVSWMDSAKSAIKDVKDGKLDAPATAGTTGQVLTKTADGQAWADAPTELPSATSSDSGKVLTVDSSGSPEWAEAQGGGGDSGNPDYLAISLSNDNSTITLAKVGTPSEIAIEYSLDKTTWTTLVPDTAITIPTAWTKCYFRGNNTGFSSDSNYYNFVFGGGQAYIYGNVMSLLDTSCTSVTIPTAYCFTSLFEYRSGVTVQSFKLALPAIQLTEGCYKSMFKNQGSMIGKFPALPATVLHYSCYEGMFSGCNSMTGKVILPAVSPVKDCYKEMLRYCNTLQYIDCNFLPDYYGSYYMSNWLQNTGQSAPTPRYFFMPYGTYSPNTDDSHIPERWTRLFKDLPCECIKAVTASTDSSYTVTPFAANMASITVASALTLSATAIDSGSVAYAEVVIDLATGATVTAGTNLTLVDALTDNKRNICEVRWSDGAAKLRVKYVEDLPA